MIEGPGPRAPSGRPVLSASFLVGFFGVGAVAAMEGGVLER